MGSLAQGLEQVLLGCNVGHGGEDALCVDLADRVSARSSFEPTTSFPAELPWTNACGDVDILHVEAGIAPGVIRKRGATSGNPAVEIEKRLDVVATTRTAGTIERLVHVLT